MLGRGKYEAFENVRRQDQLARRERQEASAVRDRLEKRCVEEGRADLGRIVAMASVDALAKRQMTSTLAMLREVAQLRRRRVPQEPDKAGNDPAYGDRYVSPLKADRVRDVDGRLIGDGRGLGLGVDSGEVRMDGPRPVVRGGDHFPEDSEPQGVEDILTPEDFLAMMRRRWRGKFF